MRGIDGGTWDPSLWTTRSDKHALAETLRYLRALSKGKPATFNPDPKHGAKCWEKACYCPKIVSMRSEAVAAIRAEVIALSLEARALPDCVAAVVRECNAIARQSAACGTVTERWFDGARWYDTEEEYMRGGGYERLGMAILYAQVEQRIMDGDYPNQLYVRRELPGLAERIEKAHEAALADNERYDRAPALKRARKVAAPAERVPYVVCLRCPPVTVPRGARVCIQRCMTHAEPSYRTFGEDEATQYAAA